MFQQPSRRRFWCLLLSLVLVFEPLVLAAEQAADKGPQEEAFNASEAVSPGEYLAKIKELRGENRQEIEKNSYAQWANLMMNVFVMLDPNATDVPSYQTAVGSVINTEGSVRGFVADTPFPVKILGKATTWGLTHFAKAESTFGKFSGNLLKAWKWVGDKNGTKKFFEFAKFMKAPSGSKQAASFQQWLRRAPPTEGVESMSKVAGTAMIIGTVIQILAGCAEIKSFFDAKSDDPGAISWGTVSHAVQGTLLIATAIMALIPPPGVWAVAAVVIMAIWNKLKMAFDKIGEKIQKWHKVYEDSLTFLKETDPNFSAFLGENKDASTFGCDQEKSAALVFADRMKAALEKSPGEGDVAKRQKDLVQNMRDQGLLSTWYYQQATASREIPADRQVLYTIWNHRADYMAWKPKKPGWHGFSLGGIGESLGELKDFAIDSVGQWVLGTDDQINEDMQKHPNKVHFCPDFALMIYYRNFITHQRVDGEQKLSPLMSIVGLRIEEAPYNYIPLIDIYNNNFSSWNNAVLAEAFAADTFNVGVKELPLLNEQVKASKDEFQAGYRAMLAKVQAMDAGSDFVKDGDSKGPLEGHLKKQLECSARMRGQLEGLVDAWKRDRDENIKNLKVDYTFDGDEHDFKLIDELFNGKQLFTPPAGRWAGAVPLPPLNTALLKGEDKPRDEDRTPAKIFELYKDDLANCLQASVNSLGITGIDMVQMGIQAKTQLDILALAKRTHGDRQEALDSLGQVFKTDAFKRLIEKGEYLDVNRGGLENFFSGYDPPKDVLEHEIGKFKDAIEDGEEDIQDQKEKIARWQKLAKDEYVKWLAVLEKYESVKDEIGMTLEISASDANYDAKNLDFVTELAPLNPEMEVP